MDEIDPEGAFVNAEQDLLPESDRIFGVLVPFHHGKQTHALQDHKNRRIVQKLCQFLYPVHVTVSNNSDQKQGPYHKQNSSAQL